MTTKVESRKSSDAHIKAVAKYNASLSRITFRMPHDVRTQLDEHAAKTGESATAFLIRAIKAQIERDNAEK